MDHDKKNFLISLFSSIAIFLFSFLAGSYLIRYSKILGIVSFFIILILGLTIFILLMHKFRKK
jgi:cytochrome c oxidase subunit IV